MNIARAIVWTGILFSTAAFWIMVGMYLAKQFN
jgi:hypothetical protein